MENVLFYLISRVGLTIVALQKVNTDVLGKVLFLLILVRVHWISGYYKLMFSILFVKFPFFISAFSFFLFCLILTLLSSQDPKYMYIILLDFYSSDFCGSIQFSPIFLSPFFGLGNFYFSNFNFTDSDDSCPLLRSFYTFLFKLLYFSSLKNSFLKTNSSVKISYVSLLQPYKNFQMQ